jgi:hypothetical protein
MLKYLLITCIIVGGVFSISVIDQVRIEIPVEEKKNGFASIDKLEEIPTSCSSGFHKLDSSVFCVFSSQHLLCDPSFI